MTFKAMVRCDADGCNKEAELECFDPANAEDAVFNLDNWFVNTLACDHYCPCHAKAAKTKWDEESPQPTGIYPTMVG
ncbi:hypothetical protein C9J12_18185 [Photobacterium frigidiphilum]|uniref:Uncharacterized protein n=1 Tax=Photobacterium frigidiphilum TaxID=264736 RepID=A0A2T3JCQ3_9GAMM|nr:hypothetical protein [Photobacterium frigidiphilum]PSU46639.1 hypothetical protein C9J12_18185 [Photobacterium frigidiphilum]